MSGVRLTVGWEDEEGRYLVPDEVAEFLRKQGAEEVRPIFRRACDALEEAGNHFDHDNPAAAREAVARWFELWAEDARDLLGPDGD